MTESIYKAPDIRRQTLEEAEAKIAAKRVARMIMASKHQQTTLDKATKLHGKQLVRFEKQQALFEKGMEDIAAKLEKMQTKLNLLSEIHSELTNIEGVIDDNSN